jgi:branched-chain amino acid transport system permease protein
LTGARELRRKRPRKKAQEKGQRKRPRKKAKEKGKVCQCQALRFCLIVLAGLLVAGCALISHPEQRNRCRLLLGILHPPEAIIDVTGQSATPGRVDLRYTTQQAGALRKHLLVCGFGDFQEGDERLLIDAVSDGQRLADAQLFFLNRFAFPDPEFQAGVLPLTKSELGALPEVPQQVAIVAQQALAQAPIPLFSAMIAAAYALIYGLVGRVNLAFAPFISLGSLAAGLGFAMTLAMLDGMPVAALVGGLLLATALSVTWGETTARVILLPLIKGRGQAVLIATVGLMLAAQELLRLTQGTSPVFVPPLAGGSMPVLRAGSFIVTVTPSAIIVVSCALLPCLLLLLTMRYTRFGREWRAVADEPVAASLFGISQERVLVIASCLSGIMVGLCGFLLSLHYGGLNFADGTPFALKALTGAIIGGIGSVGGAMLGGFAVGVFEILWSSTMPIAQREIALFLLLVLFMILKPGGLFGDKNHHPRLI